MPRIKAVMFDLDGTLCDLGETHYEALNKALEYFHLHITPEQHKSTFDGLPTARKLELLGVSPDIRKPIAYIKQAETIRLIQERVRPNLELDLILANLYEQGIPIAVCSNAVRATIKLVLSKMRIDSAIDHIISNQDVEKPKPDPEMYLKAMKLMNRLPDECVAVEDHDHGVAAAAAAGCHVLKVAGPHQVTRQVVLGFIDKLNSEA